MSNTFKTFIVNERLIFIITVVIFILFKFFVFIGNRTFKKDDLEQVTIERFYIKQIDSVDKINASIIAYDSLNETYSKFMITTNEKRNDFDSLILFSPQINNLSDTNLIMTESRMNYLKEKEKLLNTKKEEIEKLILLFDSLSPKYSNNYRTSIKNLKTNLEEEQLKNLNSYKIKLVERGNILSFLDSFILLYMIIFYPIRWVLALILRRKL